MNKIAILASHPIQYQAPLFRKLSQHPDIELTVYFCWDFGVGKERFDPGFGRKIKWDIPLLEGYRHKFIPNWSPWPSSAFFGQINPGVIIELFQNHYDAIWIHGYTSITNLLAFSGAMVSKTPIMLRGESHLLNYRPAWKRILKRTILFLLFKRISSFLAIGTLNTEYYKHYGVPVGKIFHTPYAVDNEFFSGKYRTLYKERDRIKKEFGIACDLPVILYASKMIPRKRAMDLLKAYEMIQKKFDAALVFVGDGIEKPVLEAYAENLNLENVHFVGFKNQTELPALFVIADIFVLPSTDEPWGLVINEAMNFGLPVITTDKVGAAPDLVKHGGNGFIYPAGDIEKLASYLIRLLQDSHLREKMGKRSLEIIDRWSFKEDMEGILAALEYLK